MKTISKPLKYSLIAGCFYFICIAVAHFLELKIAGLYVYDNTPFYALQDKMISFASLLFAVIFYLASRYRPIIPVALIILACTVIGLFFLNLDNSFLSHVQDGQSTYPYWGHTGLLSFYLLLLTVLYVRGFLRKEKI